jgi:hypothetical protein
VGVSVGSLLRGEQEFGGRRGKLQLDAAHPETLANKLAKACYFMLRDKKDFDVKRLVG